MTRFKFLTLTASAIALAGFSAHTAFAANFNIPPGDLKTALNAYTAVTGVELVFPSDEMHGTRTKGVKGSLSQDDALVQLLQGTGFTMRREAGAIAILHTSASSDASPSVNMAAATAPSVSGAALETVTVTSSKIGGDVQNIPIAITAMSQEQLTQTQTAGGPDLVKQVPNLTFSKTNFTGYNIQIRGIGTQAISVTTDPAVAVAFNDIPFIRNHFFEQEFFDVSQVEVLRGPQGTLYGRNATAGVVNLVSAKPTDQYEAQASVDVGNYNNRRFEGMLNVPLVGDKLDIRVAGEWTKRDGYTFNDENGHSVDGRDLWSGRLSILFHPLESVTANLVWEHFSENDDRMRSSKQLCTRDPGPATVDGPFGPLAVTFDNNGRQFLTQGCLPGSLYAPTAFQAPNGDAIPFVVTASFGGLEGIFGRYIQHESDPYAGLAQSQSLRTIDSQIDPTYRAKNDTIEFNADWNVMPELTLTAQTGYNKDFLYSTEDFNRFNTLPDLLSDAANSPFAGDNRTLVGQDNQYCDPQLGCSSRLVAEDMSRERAWQFSQELRLASDYKGPLNFSFGANYMHYETLEDYFVFSNLLTVETETPNGRIWGGTPLPVDAPHIPFDATFANSCNPQPANPALALNGFFGLGCAYIDPNPLSQINGNGHNYFRSENPYRLNSWAGFGEVYYQVMPEVKLTSGLRWTDDRKHFDEIPSWALVIGEGYPILGSLDQEWKEWTGRFNATWTPKLDFTDQSLFYASYSRGYKGGGANPPGVIPIGLVGTYTGSVSNLTHPLTFKPEFINAYEAGTKNTLLDGAMTINADVFYYDYKNYQISQIVDRTSVNLNFNATVRGAEIESTWEPLPGLRFNIAGGYQDGTLAAGSRAIDLMDRTAGHSGWMVVKPFVSQTSNCVLPSYLINTGLASEGFNGVYQFCYLAYSVGDDPITMQQYAPYPTIYNSTFGITNVYPGFDPLAGTPGDPYTGQNTFDGVDYGPAPNNGEGFAKNLAGNKLPNTPPFTLSVGAQYSMPVSADWAATGRVDGYWQGNSFARVFNDKPYDQIHGYTNVNLALIFTNQDGWQAMAYMKNVFNTTAITGAFLNSDDTALTTNVFVTDPRLFGLRITKNW